MFNSNSHLRYFIIFSILIGLFIIPSLIESLVTPLILSNSKKIFLSKGINVDFLNSNFSLKKGLVFDQIRISRLDNNKFPEFKFTDVNIYFKKIFPPYIGLDFKFADSSITCQNKLNLSFKPTLNCTINDLNLRKLPLFKPLDPSGNISGLLKNLNLNDSYAESGEIELLVNKVSFNPKLILSKFELSSDLIKLSPIEDITGNIFLNIILGSINLKGVSLSSSHGDLSLNGIINNPNNFDLKLFLKLNELGKKEIEPWFQLVQNIPEIKWDGSSTFSIKKGSSLPQELPNNNNTQP